MGFPFLATFKQWDPLTGQSPKYHTEEFDEIIRRARKLLQNRTTPQIIKALKILDNAYRESYYDGMFKLEEGQKFGFVTLQTDINKIKAYLTEHPIEDKNKFAWHENYALIVLAMSGSFSLSDHEKDVRRELLEYSLEDLKSEYLRSALEIITEAIVCLEIGEGLLPAHKKKQIAGKERHSDTTKLKNQFIEYVKSNNPTNMSEAARRFYRNRPDISLRLSVETDDNIVRIFTKAERAYRKEKQK